METLKHDSVKALVYRAVKAGNTCPSLTQLQTLALAVGDRLGFEFLKNARLVDKLAIKNCIAALVYGEEPRKVSTNVGAFFGMEGGKEGQIASEGQTRIYTPKPVERTVEDQRDIAKRKQVPYEEKHPLTSDRATTKTAVPTPLAEKTDKRFKDILERGADHLDEIDKETRPKKAGLAKTSAKQDFTLKFRIDTGNKDYLQYATKMQQAMGKAVALLEEETTGIFNGGAVFTLIDSESAPATTAAYGALDFDPKTMYKTDAARYTHLDGCAMTDCKHHAVGADDCRRDFISVDRDAKCLNYTPQGQDADTTLAQYASRIKRGEAPELVLREALASVQPVKMVLTTVNPGDSVMVDQPGGKGPITITVDDVGKTQDNKLAITGKDPGGNIMQGEVMLTPSGQAGAVSQQTPGY